MIHTFRVASAKDVEDIVAIDYELFPENNFNDRTLLTQIEKGSTYLVYVDSNLAAYLMCSRASDPLIDILRLGVRKPYRGIGIANSLLHFITRLGSDVMLTVRKENIPAITLYKKHKFEITGMMPQHDSWIMMRTKTTSSSS